MFFLCLSDDSGDSLPLLFLTSESEEEFFLRLPLSWEEDLPPLFLESCGDLSLEDLPPSLDSDCLGLSGSSLQNHKIKVIYLCIIFCIKTGQFLILCLVT